MMRALWAFVAGMFAALLVVLKVRKSADFGTVQATAELAAETIVELTDETVFSLDDLQLEHELRDLRKRTKTGT